MRYCSPEGCLDMKEKRPIGYQSNGWLPWFSIKNKNTETINIVFGHWASLNGLSQTPRVFAIDTGCSWGHRLTALRLEDHQVFSVPSKTQAMYE